MYFGSAWYPEQWDERRWPRDLELMAEAGMNVARTGEYAWCRLEPEEGRFELDWLERAVDLAAGRGVRIVLSTPSDAPPAWLTQKYPDTLRTDEHGRRQSHGGRRQFSPASERYRELSARIAEKMAQRFGRHENVLGWQTANEFCYNSYDENTRAMFQRWLAEKYGSLDELNRRWTTAYWSQEYTDFSQIPLPAGWQNPCITLEWWRFSTQVFRDFQARQVSVIRAHADERQWITHNAHCFDGLDFNDILDDLDVAAWDPYPGGEPVDPRRLGWYSDLCRTMKPRPHWIIEVQPGRVNWRPPNRDLIRGEVRNMVWHFLGHGAEAALFWQWRPGPGTHEQYHGSVIAVDGEPRPLFAEIVQIGAEMKKASPLLDNTRAIGQVALLHSYADLVAINGQGHHDQWDTLEHLRSYYAPLRAAGVEVDVLDPRREWEEYPLVVAPNLHLLNDALVARLVGYVRGGGHLLLGARSGFKDDANALLLSRQPGNELGKLLGAHAEDFYSLIEPVNAAGPLGQGKATIWSEPLAITAGDAEALLMFGRYNGWIDEKPAVVTRAADKGRITYCGTWLDETLAAALIARVLDEAGVKPAFGPVPEGVEVCRRVGERGEVFVLVNFTDEPQSVALPRPMREVLSDAASSESLALEPRGIAVLM